MILAREIGRASCRQDYSCMEETGGYLNCQERTTACQRYDECDDNSAAHRTGNLCEASPYFNGGYPMESFRLVVVRFSKFSKTIRSILFLNFVVDG